MNSSKEGSAKSRLIAFLAISTALVAAATMVFQLYIPSTRGYFNIGEVMVYTTALLFGPFIGGFAGGVGSALADVFTGYFVYAPATLVIKGVEGFLVGFLTTQNIPGSRKKWFMFTFLLALIVSLITYFVGVNFYVGAAEFSIGLFSAQTTLSIFIPEVFWVVLSVVLFLVIVVAGFLVEPQIGWVVFSVVIGGVEMVLGYFLYEQFVLGYYAFLEVPFNIAQAVIGLIISIPLYKIVKKVTEGRVSL